MQSIVYSHLEYSDILNIQQDYITNFIGCNLAINSSLYDNKKFNKIYVYDDSKPYAERIFTSLLNSDLNEKYTFLIHDVDVVLNINKEYFDVLTKIMDNNNIDRIDLKHQNLVGENKISLKDKIISKTSYPQDQYVYNVNPSIWKTSSLLKAFSIYREQSYRNIEHSTIQSYCSQNFNFFITHYEKPINMGYYSCGEDFKFLHVSHYGEFLPLHIDKTNMNEENFSVYKNIINKYNLLNGKRSFRKDMH
jgi:hypothetical protein